MWRRPVCQTLSNALDTSNATARVAPNLLKALEISADPTVRRSTVDQEDLKPCSIGNQKKGHISIGDRQAYTKILLTTERRLILWSDRLFLLLAYVSLVASRTFLQQLPACLNFTLDSEDLFCWYQRKKWAPMAAALTAKSHGDK